MSTVDVNAVLAGLLEGRRGLRVSGAAERSPISDAMEFVLELRIAEREACEISGPVLVRASATEVRDLVAQKVDAAAARLRGMLIRRLLAEPVTFDDDTAADQEERRRLGKTLCPARPESAFDAAAREHREHDAAAARYHALRAEVGGAFKQAMAEVDRVADAPPTEGETATAYRSAPAGTTAGVLRQLAELPNGGKQAIAPPLAPALYRPPVELYARCTLDLPGGLTVEPGLEWRDGEALDQLSNALLDVVAEASLDVAGYRDLNTAVRAAIELAWPDRAWFVEIHGSDGSWTQQFQPFGMPRSRPRASVLRRIRGLLTEQPDPGTAERTALLWLLAELLETA